MSKVQGRMSTVHDSLADEDGADGEDFDFEVWTIWQESRHTPKRIMTASTTKFGKSTSALKANSEDDSEDGDSDDGGSVSHQAMTLTLILSKLMIQPTCIRRTLWDLLGCIIVVYEVVIIPFQFFDPPVSLWQDFLAWVVRIYWTMDFPSCFVTGYAKPDGDPEMRPSFVARRYMLTWGVFDLSILWIDWMEHAVRGVDSLGAMRVAKISKIVRLLRMLRVLRLLQKVKVQDWMPELMSSGSFANYFQSEGIVIVLGIIRSVVFVALLAHLIACCWYGIGSLEDGLENSWLHIHDVADASLGYRYATSYHWSLTQFTGSTDIQPHNLRERVYAVVVLLFAFVIAASVVSSITSSLTRLQIVTARQSTQLSMLKQFLYDNNISTKVALRVQRNALYAIQQEKKNIPEANIELLEHISEPLRVELHYEINAPILTQHPFFRGYDAVQTEAMRRICHTAVTRVSLSRGDLVFCPGEVPTQPVMYFVLNGHLSYIQDGVRAETVRPPSWVCEAFLWTPWVHCGTLKAKEYCCLCMLNAREFQAIATQFQTEENHARNYATEFVAHLNELPAAGLSDIHSFDAVRVSSQARRSTVAGGSSHDAKMWARIFPELYGSPDMIRPGLLGKL